MMIDKFMKSTDNILLVEDEPGVLQTFAEWLQSSGFDIKVYQARDAETALKIAAEFEIDLAILDWNLGTGLNGLDLLEDLFIFQPNIVAILVTGYANQATPLHAMRIGVRDYLDKSQDLTRDKFLEAVLKQLQKLRPQKTQRVFQKKLESFKDMVARALEMLDANSAFKNESTLDSTCNKIIKAAFELFPMKNASVYQINPGGIIPSQGCTVFTYDGKSTISSNVDFSSSLASSVCNQLSFVPLRADLSKNANQDLFILHPFETNSQNALFLPLVYETRLMGVLEFVDPQESSEIKFDKLISIYAELLGKSMDQDKARNHLLLIMEKALKLADPLNSQDITSQSLGDNISNVIAETGISAEEIEFLNQVRALQNRFGKSALSSSTELLKTVEKMLLTSFGEASK
ncbi:MAG: response regulator [Planctomycetota bacterium]|jgi:ActR/RegA family two-component response regulator|nr:response regulator [Gemmataceae bacterium]RLS59717.1 MAG: response regulator [Planctomycetota bacterium]RLS90782.1 MAG: response regulator [Planctomycetota bacterium]